MVPPRPRERDPAAGGPMGSPRCGIRYVVPSRRAALLSSVIAGRRHRGVAVARGPRSLQSLREDAPSENDVPSREGACQADPGEMSESADADAPRRG